MSHVQLLRVQLPFATFGLECKDGTVVRPAPIAKYTRGWSLRKAHTYFAGRGAKLLIIESGAAANESHDH